MKPEQLLDALAAVDDASLEEVNARRQQKKSRRWGRWAALAACLCLAVLGGVLLFRPRPEAGWPVKQVPAAESSTSGEIAQLPPWD